jgi:predicted amidohydrolase
LVFDPCGEEIARYDKQHLFDVDVQDQIGRYRESDTFEPGDAPRVVPTSFGTVGLSVCYDLRFPEFFTRLTALGAEVIAVPSAFTAVTGAAHFEILVRARAIENACFLVAACQSGGHDSGRETFGHSMVVSPWGEVLACREAGPGVFITTLDLQDLRRVRSTLPSWRRPTTADHASV